MLCLAHARPGVRLAGPTAQAARPRGVFETAAPQACSRRRCVAVHAGGGEGGNLPIQRMEMYTECNGDEVLYVYAEVEGEVDEILVFKGFSSSMVRPTAYDLDTPVLPAGAKVDRIDRMVAPYSPNDAKYIQEGILWEEMDQILSSAGL